MVAGVPLAGLVQEYVLHTPDIDTQPLRRWTREHWILAGLSAFLLTSVSAIVPGFAQAMREAQPSSEVRYALALPDIASTAAQPTWQYLRVEPGQNLSDIFEQLGLPKDRMRQAINHELGRKALVGLRAGEQLAFEIAGSDTLHALRFEESDSHRIELRFTYDGVQGQRIEIPLERRVVAAEGEITSSLSADGARAGLSPAAINQLANIFKYDIDFVEDVRDGDRFQVVVEELWREGERVGYGGVIAASYITKKHRYTAFEFEHNGKVEYFDETGRPLRKTLLRIPIEFARLSSTFGARRHPVLGRMRMHKGVDYAARTGTPIMAAGDARVKFVGWKGGYGKTVELDHGQGRTTLYGHMSRFGRIRVGQQVAQGTTIGFVGSTGMSTGPHLHYEFRVNGRHVNPLTVTMPKPEPLRGDALARFRANTAPAVAKLQRLERQSELAAR